MGIRDESQRAFRKGSDRAKKLIDNVRSKAERAPALQASMERLGIAGKWTWEKFSEAQFAVENKMRQYMGFDKYRAELENCMEEALKVIAAQEERIRILEQRAARPK